MASWLREVRGLIPITREKVYFDNAGAGPLSKPVLEAIEGFARLWAERGEPWDEALEHIVEARRLFAGLIGARLEEVAAVPGVTYGYNALLSSLRLDGRGKAVAAPYNFPTTYYSLHGLRSRGLLKEVVILDSPEPGPGIGDWERAIDDETVLVVVDMVSWITGKLEDLKALAEIAHSHGAILVTDAFHAVGVIPVDVKRLGVDALLCGSYKWLMGPHGAGFVYVSKRLLDELDPMLSGWMAVEDSVIERMWRGEPLFERPFNVRELKPARDAKVLEWGTWPAIAFEGTLAALKLIHRYRAPERYSSHTSRLVERLMDGLEAQGYTLITPRDSKAAIVTFRHTRPYEVAKALYAHDIIVSPRPGRIRVSPHFYNTPEEVDRFLEVLREAEKRLKAG
ncbi:MAG: aminotransferase class V-fold PLP-dependent enzyme [Desulfurococcales archaeon]|nr:aminotransferase class V-fold PLP-dependent enzyme [Desulfurococcales archaeon]